MSDFIISTDTTADLPEEYIQKHELMILSLSYTIDGETYERGHDLDPGEFYDKMRNGSMPTTSQVNIAHATEKFEELLKTTEKDILHIAFSSGLSGTYNSTCAAAQSLMEEYPGRKIIVIDSLCASLGEGLLLHKAIQKRSEGCSLEETAQWIEEHKLNLCHIFTVDDLFHLYRGGRVSKATAVLGTMINIKPVLHVDNEGHLIPIGKVRGRKKSLSALITEMEQRIEHSPFENDCVFISHGDCLSDAQYVAQKVTETFGITDIMIHNVGPTIGAHSGPGTVALFFMGTNR